MKYPFVMFLREWDDILHEPYDANTGNQLKREEEEEEYRWEREEEDAVKETITDMFKIVALIIIDNYYF